MTTWLEFRSEPMSDVPEISVELRGSTVIHLSCDASNCDWHEDVLELEEMDEKASAHKQWHEDGMPQ